MMLFYMYRAMLQKNVTTPSRYAALIARLKRNARMLNKAVLTNTQETFVSRCPRDPLMIYQWWVG